MGGALDRVTVRLLFVQDGLQPSSNRHSSNGALLRLPSHTPKFELELLCAKFARFRAEYAKCFVEAERQRLLAVIESGFGHFNEFNQIVRRILATRTKPISRSRSSRWRGLRGRLSGTRA